MALTIPTPMALAKTVGTAEVSRRALAYVQGKTAAEILSMLGTLDYAARSYNRTDEAFRLAQLTASIWRTQLARIAPGTYVTLSNLH